MLRHSRTPAQKPSKERARHPDSGDGLASFLRVSSPGRPDAAGCPVSTQSRRPSWRAAPRACRRVAKDSRNRGTGRARSRISPALRRRPAPRRSPFAPGPCASTARAPISGSVRCRCNPRPGRPACRGTHGSRARWPASVHARASACRCTSCACKAHRSRSATCRAR